MVPHLRKQFNQHFTEEKYEAYIRDIENMHPGALDFRVAETPVFVPKDFTQSMLSACDSIIDVITRDDFKQITQRSIPSNLNVPGENDRPEFLIFDFGVCENANGKLEPQLIEMQAFPSLFAYQSCMSQITEQYAGVPDDFSAYLSGFNSETYAESLKQIILNGHAPEHVILLEIYPAQQKTRIDFYCTEKMLGIQPVCLTELLVEDKQLYYMRRGVKTPVHRIFNRLIFDDLHQQEGWQQMTDLTQELNVEWVPHPNWFYRVSKFTLPFIDHPNVPDSFFLNELSQPVQLSDYVLKPLFSFAGMGVVIDVTQEDIDKIPDPENWILQKKVQYADVILTPDEPAKAELRLFYFWDKTWDRPIAVHNLARLSKGKMIGTRYNKNKTWVGGTIAYFEK
ncbi:MAG TPA: hypothetical protein PKY29_10325 [Ferruginibacter sp.]|nr:hypothetical protein [Ferruginibacter sp.]HRO17618.1 hypothetical protein [Ferruginibacter sp.]HRQ21703.1 hypothetical protein [Ferruginibacter sp.]